MLINFRNLKTVVYSIAVALRIVFVGRLASASTLKPEISSATTLVSLSENILDQYHGVKSRET